MWDLILLLLCLNGLFSCSSFQEKQRCQGNWAFILQKHPSHRQKDISKFLQVQRKEQSLFMRSVTTVWDRVQGATSYNISQLTANAQIPHSTVPPSFDQPGWKPSILCLESNSKSKLIDIMSHDMAITLIYNSIKCKESHYRMMVLWMLVGWGHRTWVWHWTEVLSELGSYRSAHSVIQELSTQQKRPVQRSTGND